MGLTRAEHIAWCKERAINEMDYYKDPRQGLVSMMSDLSKHPDTNSQALIQMCAMHLALHPRMSRQQAVNFINGFN